MDRRGWGDAGRQMCLLCKPRRTAETDPQIPEKGGRSKATPLTSTCIHPCLIHTTTATKKKTKDRKQDIQAINVLSSSEHALICVFVTCVNMCICPHHVHLEVRGHHQGRPLSASSFATGLLSDPSAHGLFRTHKQ